VTKNYSARVFLHNKILAFRTPDPALFDRFSTVYGHLPKAKNAHTEISIFWQLTENFTAPPPPELPVISEDNLVSYFGNKQQVALRMARYALITVDLTRNQLNGVVTRRCLDVYGAFEDVMMISLAPLYRRAGWYPLHAFAALSPGGKAALISGEMGSGKTSTGLALLSAGWKLLSNDSPLLRLRENLVEALAYPGQLSAFDDSLARFPGLQKFIPPERSENAPVKRVFRVEEAFPAPWAEWGVAGGVFFPQVVPGLSHSNLVKVAPTEAMLALLPQAIEGWDKAAIGGHLHLLGKLVEQVPCYKLFLSPAVNQLPDLLKNGMKGNSRI